MNISGRRSNNGVAFDIWISDDDLDKIGEGYEGIRQMLVIQSQDVVPLKKFLFKMLTAAWECKSSVKKCKCGNDVFSLHTDEDYIKVFYNPENKSWEVERLEEPKVNAFLICKKCGQAIHYTEDPDIHAALEYFLA